MQTKILIQKHFSDVRWSVLSEVPRFISIIFVKSWRESITVTMETQQFTVYSCKVFQKTPMCLCQYTENVIWNIFYTDGEVRSDCWWDALYFREITSALIEISVMLDLCFPHTHIDEHQWHQFPTQSLPTGERGWLTLRSMSQPVSQQHLLNTQPVRYVRKWRDYRRNIRLL